jgi:hypothetical protein
MQMTTLLSPARDGVAESVLAMARQGATNSHQGAAIDRLGIAIDRLGAAAECWLLRCPR